MNDTTPKMKIDYTSEAMIMLEKAGDAEMIIANNENNNKNTRNIWITNEDPEKAYNHASE